MVPCTPVSCRCTSQNKGQTRRSKSDSLASVVLDCCDWLSAWQVFGHLVRRADLQHMSRLRTVEWPGEDDNEENDEQNDEHNENQATASVYRRFQRIGTEEYPPSICAMGYVG